MINHIEEWLAIRTLHRGGIGIARITEQVRQRFGAHIQQDDVYEIAHGHRQKRRRMLRGSPDRSECLEMLQNDEHSQMMQFGSDRLLRALHREHPRIMRHLNAKAPSNGQAI